MRYFPINVDLQDRPCVVIGGGKVAYRKVHSLLKAGAKIRLISPHIKEGVQAFVDEGKITWIEREYEPGDLEGSTIVFVAVDDPAVGAVVAEEAKKLNLLINVADIPHQCTFTLSSYIERGDLLVTISTGGKCPAYSRHMRHTLEEIVDDSYGEVLGILGQTREEILKLGVESDKCRDLLNNLIKENIVDLVREGKRDEADRLAQETVARASLK